jgi:tetratricopeptide (TPR) repeat protein
MFCKNCGKESENSQKFCTGCGKEVKPSIQYQNIEKVTRGPKPKKDWVRIIVISTIVIVVISWKVYVASENQVVETNNDAMKSFDSGNSEQAINQFQTASKNAASTENKINTLKNLAYVYSSDDQKDLAISTFKEALALSAQESFDYYLIAGEIATLEDKPNSAQISYNKAYEKNPNDFQINNALALFYLDLGDVAPQYSDYKKALQYAQRAVQLSDLQIAKQNLGVAYYFNENYPQAISILSNLTLDKDTYTAYWLGLSYARNEDPVNAKIYLRKAITGGVTVPQEVYDYLNSN